MKASNPIPRTPSEWLREIALAFNDARDAIPFGEMLGEALSESELFHIAPDVSLKFRGLPQTIENRERAAQAALASYIETKSQDEESLDDPFFTFGFCYLASHFGLGLLTESEAEEVILFLDANRKQLHELAKQEIEKRRKEDDRPIESIDPDLAGKIGKKLLDLLGPELRTQVGEYDLDPAGMIQFLPVSRRCTQAREKLGMDIKEAARRAGVPQYRIRAIENGSFPQITQKEMKKYLAFLKLEEWYRNWAEKNRSLVERHELPGV